MKLSSVSETDEVANKELDKLKFYRKSHKCKNFNIFLLFFRAKYFCEVITMNNNNKNNPNNKNKNNPTNVKNNPEMKNDKNQNNK